MLNYDLVIIGGGPAGLAAAIGAKENGLESILVLERDRELGGILNQCIHSGFGLEIFKEELTGPEYAQRFINKLKDMKIDYKIDTMVLEISPEKYISCINTRDGLMNIEAKSVILAMGCRERPRGALNIAGTRPVGIYNAGLAQRLINIEGYMLGKKVIILGSGDIGLIMARRLVLEGAEVIGVLARGSFPAGLSRNIVQCLEDFNIPLMLNHTISQIKGRERIESVIVTKTDRNKKPIRGTELEYICDTLLISAGLIPENELSKALGLTLDKNTGGPIVDEGMETEIPGIFACGNVLHVHDLVDYVSKESKRAGKRAAEFVKQSFRGKKEYIELRPGQGISYIVPQRVNINNLDRELEVFLRVEDIYKDIRLSVRLDGRELVAFKSKILLPSEMIKLKLKSDIFKEKLGTGLTIEVLEGDKQYD